MLRDVLITPAPSWLIGEGDEKPEYLVGRDGIRTIPEPVNPDDHYPDDYAGKVVAVRRSGWRWTEMDLAGGRVIVQMELTDQEAGWVSSRTRKIINGERVPITFEDRWGSQIAARLRERFDDAEDAERRSDDPNDYIGRQFAAQSVLFKKLLTPVVVHTGAGLYEVGPAKTYSTWSAALAQLWTDQGAAEFTATQYIRGFADTYDETITPNASLNPSERNGLSLIIEGDPTDSRNNMIVQPTSGRAVNVAMDMIILRHMKCVAADSDAVTLTAGCNWAVITDCDITAVGSNEAINAVPKALTVEDCAINSEDDGIFVGTATGVFVHRCVITATAGQVDAGIWLSNGASGLIEACTIDGFSDGVFVQGSQSADVFRNNTFYNCDEGLSFNAGDIPPAEIDNNIFLSCTTNIKISAWPDETGEGSVYGPIQLRNNSFYDYTNFVKNRSNVTRTYAQFIVMDGVDAGGNLNAIDPLLTNPGAGDFSLQGGSPCRNTGHGAGTVTGVNAVAFDPNNPDIGGWSSGVLASDPPTWASNTSNISATDAASDSEVDLTWDAATPGSGSVGYILESRTPVGAGSWVEQGRTVGTTFTIPNLVNETSYDFRPLAYSRISGEPTTTPSDTDSATPTAADIPDAPAIAATDLLNQSEVRVDIVAGNAADVSTIYYQIVPDGALQTWGNTVTGSGSETLLGLLVKPYVIYAIATRGGCTSAPSNLALLTLQAADQYTAIRTALYEWVKGVVGNPVVIWREPNAPQPARQYVSIKMNPTTTIGSDYHSGADTNGVETVEGNREFVFSVQIHGKPSNEDGSASISILERIRSSLEKETIRATLKAAGLAFVVVEGSGDLAGIGGTEWEARAFKDFRFRTTYQDTDDVGYIGTVETPVGTLE